MTQKNSLTSFEMNLENEFPRDGYGRITGRGYNQRTTLRLDLEITPETGDSIALAISKAINTPSAGFSTLKLDHPAVNRVALDGILDALQGHKVAKLEAEVARGRARVLELEKALQDTASAFETIEFLSDPEKCTVETAQSTVSGIANEYADKAFEAATKGEAPKAKTVEVTFDIPVRVSPGFFGGKVI